MHQVVNSLHKRRIVIAEREREGEVIWHQSRFAAARERERPAAVTIS